LFLSVELDLHGFNLLVRLDGVPSGVRPAPRSP
jgi:hypothetical protein